MRKIVFIGVLLGLGWLVMGLSSHHKTLVHINNQTDQSIKNLVFTSNDSKVDHKINFIKSQESCSFEYDLGGFNENAAVLKHFHDKTYVKTYSVIGYVDQFYDHIHVDIVSIDENKNLIIKVQPIKSKSLNP